MTDVDMLSSSEWSYLLDHLQISKPVSEIESSNILGKEFNCIDKWEMFYNTYSKWIGFSTRMDDVKRNGEIITMRRWVCSKEGFRRSEFLNKSDRKKRPKPIIRTGCQAALRVVRCKTTGSFIAKEFVHQHNHETLSPVEVQFARSHRNVSDSLLAQVMSMNKVGIKTAKIMSHIALQSGGYNNIPCQLRDIYNKVAGARRANTLESDSEGALGYLDCLSQRDPDFYVEYQVDDENRLSNLFWADGNSSRDYFAFNEVLAFDTTYRTNEYNKPLTILIGVNHHFETCIFGLALLLDETYETYCWILKVFLDCMNGNKPSVVVTDGDPAMKLAISQLLPESTHRLCAWHITINATKNLHKPKFNTTLYDLMMNNRTEEEFHLKWITMLENLNLTDKDKDWCHQLYEKRESWGEPFLRGKFVGGMTTTQRCESMNSYLKKFLQADYPLREFVQQIDLGVQKMRHGELQKDYITKHTSPQLPPTTNPLRPYYEQCAKIFTRDIYHKVAEQISKENAYSVTNRENQHDYAIYSLSKFNHGNIRNRVCYYTTQNKLSCTCRLFETNGFPCRHIFAVMKNLNISHIPTSCIMKRWCKDAKSHSPLLQPQPSNKQRELFEMSRYGALNSDANMMIYYASKVESSYKIAKDEIARLTSMFKEAFDANSSNDNDNSIEPRSHCNNPNIIRDPVVVRKKGSHQQGSRVDGFTGEATSVTAQKARLCSICKGGGHDARNCVDRERLTRVRGGPSSSNNTNDMQDSTQDSFPSSQNMY